MDKPKVIAGILLPDNIASRLWSGSTMTIESVGIDSRLGHDTEEEARRRPVPFYYRLTYPPDSDLRPTVTMVTRIELTHPDSPITIIYEWNLTHKKPTITAEGLYEASNRDIQKVLPVINRLRPGGDLEKPTSEDYNQAFERLEAGEDWDEVKADFLATTSGSSEAFNAAMYYRRKKSRNNK